MAQLEPCPLCGGKKWVGLKCRCVIRAARSDAEQRRHEAKQRRAARQKWQRPLILMTVSMTIWTMVLILISNEVARETDDPGFRVIVPGLAAIIGGWTRTGYDYEDGFDLWKIVTVPLPFAWHEHWESFCKMWRTMHNPIYKGFYIAVSLTFWIGLLQMPKVQSLIGAL